MYFFFFNLILGNLLLLFLIRVKGDFFIWQLHHIFIFMAGIYFLFVLLNVYLFSFFKKTKNIPVVERIWVFPLILLVADFLLLWGIFFIPSYFKESFWSRFLEIPTPFFARTILYWPWLLLFNMLFFVFWEIEFYFKNVGVRNASNKGLWRKRRGYFLIILFFLIVVGFYFLTTNPAYLLYFKVKSGGNNSTKFLWEEYNNSRKSNRLYDYIYYLLLKKEDTPSLDFYWEKYQANKVSNVYSDDIYYLLLVKRKLFDYSNWKKFISLFPHSPYREELADLVILFYKKKQDEKMAAKVVKDITRLATPWSNVILKEREIYAGYYWSIYLKQLLRDRNSKFD